jgi:hypothetical protein
MAESAATDEMLTLDEAERQYGVKRATLYRYVQHGSLKTFRRAMDKRAYVRRADLEALRRFRESERRGGLSLSAVERARAFQRRVFGDRMVTPTAELIEEGRRERTEELP